MSGLRNQRGNMIVLTSAVAAVIFVPLIALFVAVAMQFVHRERAETVVEAASKLAARDIGRIVLKNDRFGYVSLSNYEPGGKRTQSKDGEPLPVVSLSAWQKTIKQADTLGKQLHNSTIVALANEDQVALDDAVSDITKQIQGSLAGDARSTAALDLNGNRVDTLQDVEKFLTENLPPNVRLVSVELTAGTSGDDSSEIDEQAHLVSTKTFVEADSKQIPSVVKLQCKFKTTDQTAAPIVATACSQTFCSPDRTTPGSMNVRFPGRPVLGLLSWNEFLTEDNFNDNQLVNYDVVDGDFPVDKDARLKQSGADTDRHATPRTFAKHLYNWILTAHGRLKNDAVLAMMNEPFLPYLNQAYTYNITADGGIVRTGKQGVPGTVALAADGEYVAMADTRVKSGTSVVVLFHDNVENLDADTAKHGGQPLQGLSLDIEVGGTGDSTARGDMLAARERTRHRRV